MKTRAEIEAQLYYKPEDFDTRDVLALGRKCFAEGYTQAEKEFRLNRARVREILEIADQVRSEWTRNARNGIDTWLFRQEILDRYNKKHSYNEQDVRYRR